LNDWNHKVEELLNDERLKTRQVLRGWPCVGGTDVFWREVRSRWQERVGEKTLRGRSVHGSRVGALNGAPLG